MTGKSADDSLNLYAYKQQLLAGYKPVAGKRGSIGIPLCLDMYELLPFWRTFWTRLGFAVHTSPVSSRGLYLAGQATIPSDTACFPAKLSHGHIKALSQMHLDAIFYPCLTYNFDEGLGDNHYNCPVVAYYPEVLAGNCPELEGQSSSMTMWASTAPRTLQDGKEHPAQVLWRYLRKKIIQKDKES